MEFHDLSQEISTNVKHVLMQIGIFAKQFLTSTILPTLIYQSTSQFENKKSQFLLSRLFAKWYTGSMPVHHQHMPQRILLVINPSFFPIEGGYHRVMVRKCVRNTCIYDLSMGTCKFKIGTYQYIINSLLVFSALSRGKFLGD